MAASKQRGIFCLETVWFDAEDQTSIRPLLEFLRGSYLKVPFIHRNAVTLDAFKHHVTEWVGLKPRTRYPILYLGYHGEADRLYLSSKDKKGLSLSEVADILRGRCNNCLVHFASCSTLTSDLGSLVTEIGASAVSGYGEDIDWVASTAFELIYLESLQYGGKKALTKDVMQRVKDGDGNHWPLVGKERSGLPFVDLSTSLGFQLHVRE